MALGNNKQRENVKRLSSFSLAANVRLEQNKQKANRRLIIVFILYQNQTSIGIVYT